MRIILSIVWVIMLPLILSAQKIWTLKECIEYAVQNNLNLQQNALNNARGFVDERFAKSTFLPSFNINSSHSWAIGLNQNITTGILENQTTQFTSFGANLVQEIYTGMVNQNRLRRSRLVLLSNQYRTQRLREDISLNVASAYLQILLSNENLDIAKNQLSNDIEQKKALGILVEGGNLPSGELLDLEANIALSKQRVVAAENALLLAKLDMIQLLQLKDYTDFLVSDDISVFEDADIWVLGPDQIYQVARKNRTEILLAKQEMEVAALDIEIAKGAALPRLSLFYNVNTRIAFLDRIIGFSVDENNPFRTIGFVENSNDLVLSPNTVPVVGSPLPFFNQFNNNLGHNFGLSLIVPVFNRNQVKLNTERASLEYDNSSLLLQQEELNLERNIYLSYFDAMAAKKTMEAAMATLEARENALEYAQQRLSAGVINSFDYSNIQNSFRNAQSEVIQAKYDYLFRLKILEFYYGIPIVQ
jgi:outer membrane protein TolC